MNRKTYTFYAYGHPNIRAEHFKTLEFTKDRDITEKGDCIVGVKAEFDKEKIKDWMHGLKKAKAICKVNDPETGEVVCSEFKFVINKEFDSDDEIVFRKSHFQSERTLGFNLNRGANRLDRKIVEILKDENVKMKVELLEGWYADEIGNPK